MIGDITLMASDNPYGGTVIGDNITLNWSHEDASMVQQVWDRFIAAGSEVHMELSPSFFARQFGVLIDPYGISWQIMEWQASDIEAL